MTKTAVAPSACSSSPYRRCGISCAAKSPVCELLFCGRGVRGGPTIAEGHGCGRGPRRRLLDRLGLLLDVGQAHNAAARHVDGASRGAGPPAAPAAASQQLPAAAFSVSALCVLPPRAACAIRRRGLSSAASYACVGRPTAQFTGTRVRAGCSRPGTEWHSRGLSSAFL